MSGAFLSGTAISLLATTGVGTAGVSMGAKKLIDGEYASGCVLLGAFACLGGIALKSYLNRFEASEPNQWLLVIEEGEQKRAAVGLQHFRTLMQTVVRFPSTMQNVVFEAEQVTKEIQGVRVKGFATWTVYREEDGPYRAYRTFDGLTPAGQTMANSQLGKLVESIVRNMVSNLTIQEVLTQRDTLRKSAREQLTEITKGWGIWIETVEITDVRISSSSLFSNLQAEFRQKTRMEAEQIQMQTDKTLGDARRVNDVATQESRERAETQKYAMQQEQQLARAERKRTDDVATQEAVAKAETKKYEVQQEQQIAREQRNFQTEQEQHKIKLQKMEQNKEYKLNQTRTNGEINQASTKAEQALTDLRKDYEIASATKSQQHERTMKGLDMELQNSCSPINLKLRMMDILDKACGRVSYDMKVVNMGQNDSLANMIPGMASLWKETMEVSN